VILDVREALAEYQAERKSRVKNKTLSEAARILGLFCSFCEAQSLQLETIKPRTVDSYLDAFQATHHSKAGGTVSSHTMFLQAAVIKAFLNWCSQSEEFGEYVDVRTVLKISTPKRDVLVRDIFTKEQIDALLLACNHVNVGSEKENAYLRDRNRAIILLLLDTGIRAAELCHLQLNHIFLTPTDAHIKVFGKGDKWREVGLGERCRKELRRFVNRHRRDLLSITNPVFLTRHGDALTESTLFRIIHQLGRQAGISGVQCSPHTFRHTFATVYMRETNDIYRLSKLMGHHSISITENYLKSFTQSDARRGAISPVNSLFE
jgi:site-specific recombinase XerD